MGKRNAYLWRQHSYIKLDESDDPGCIWGILRLLNYHRHWQNVKKKMLPHRKHATKNKGKKKAANRLKGVNEVENMGDEAGSVSSRSFKVRLRDLMTKKKSKTRALGHNVDSSSKEKLGEEVGILEIFKVNKQIFLKVLNDRDDVTPVKPDIKARLAKSGSFPAYMRDWGPSKLQDKHTEFWPQVKDRDSDPSAKSMPLLLHQNSGDGCQLSISKGKLRSMRRASSLTESTDRYDHLYNSTFNKEVKTSYPSRSFKLINENDKFRRRLSLPECEYDSFLPNLESVDRTKDSADSDGNTKCGSFDSAVNVDIGHLEQSDDATEINILAESPYEEEQMGTIELPISEDYVTGPQSQITSNLDQYLLNDLEDGNLEFHYVKLVLELSGFTAKDQTWVWYTMQKPLNPTLFEEIESQFHPIDQLKCLNKVEQNKWDRNLIFDLINEALAEIDERSCLYYPKALSLSGRVHQIPRGNRLLEEVWEFVQRCLSWRPELDPTLDFAVAQDLHGRHGWMNLQIESECIALELEDMILDEFLSDEVLLAIHQLGACLF